MSESNQKLYLVYVTFPDEKTAQYIATKVVDSKLAACANIFPAMTSIYTWQDKTETSSECAAYFKTQEGCLSRLKNFIVQSHPYECPCVVSLAIHSGHEPFLNWIQQNSR